MSKIVVFTFLLLLLFVPRAANAEWVKQNTNSFAWYKDIFFLNAERGWIVGTDGVILATTDGGQTWTQQRKFTADSIQQVHFQNERDGWLLCQRNVYARGSDAASYLRRTTDGGATWERIEFEGAGRERVTHLFFGPTGTGGAFGEGGIFYKLDEDKKTWKKVQTAIHYLLLDAAYASRDIGAIVGTGGTILFTEDSGYTWQKATLLGDADGRFNAVFFYRERGGWAVGSAGRIFNNNGGGRLWRQQNSTVTADLNDVHFISPSTGWAVGDHGIIVHTIDAGRTWTDVPSKVTHDLEKVVFAAGRGWAIGFGGTILTYSDTPGDRGSKPILMRRG